MIDKYIDIIKSLGYTNISIFYTGFSTNMNPTIHKFETGSKKIKYNGMIVEYIQFTSRGDIIFSIYFSGYGSNGRAITIDQFDTYVIPIIRDNKLKILL